MKDISKLSVCLGTRGQVIFFYVNRSSWQGWWFGCVTLSLTRTVLLLVTKQLQVSIHRKLYKECS
jgi:hypothetical protein